ncbi:MAG: hypothetical protein ACREBD_05545 [Blastocatellia bacterium]
MNEENTKDLTQDEKLDLILAEIRVMKSDIRGLDARLTSLETKVEDRLLDTRPLWEVISARTEMIVERVTRIEEQNARMQETMRQMAETLRLLEKQQGLLNRDFLKFRGEQEILEDRIYALEQRPS